MLKNFRKKQDKKAQIHIKKASVGNIWSIYKLFNRYYIKSFFGPFFSFAFPVIIYSILGSLMNYKLMYAGVSAMTCMAGLTSMPFSILELKKSILLKRIGASPVKTSKFTFVIISYFVLNTIISILWLSIWALILHQDFQMFDFLGNVVGFFSFFYGTLLTIIISISIGFLISSVSKSENQAQSISLLIMFPSQFLSGMFVSMDVIVTKESMNWISRLIPYRYSTMYMVSAVQKVNPFEYTDLYGFMKMNNLEIFEKGKAWKPNTPKEPFQKSIIFFKSWEVIVAYLYPYFIISLSTFASIKKFSWSSNR